MSTSEQLHTQLESLRQLRTHLSESVSSLEGLSSEIQEHILRDTQSDDIGEGLQTLLGSLLNSTEQCIAEQQAEYDQLKAKKSQKESPSYDKVMDHRRRRLNSYDGW